MCVVACEGEFVWFGVAPVPATRSKHQREWNRNTEHDALHRPIEADRLRSRGLFSMHADHPRIQRTGPGSLNAHAASAGLIRPLWRSRMFQILCVAMPSRGPRYWSART